MSTLNEINTKIIELENDENRHTNKVACRIFDLLVEKAEIVENDEIGD